MYYIQHGIYLNQLWGLDIHHCEGDLEKLLKWKPANNITKDFPATLVLHGDKDQVISIEDSKEVVEALKKSGVESEFIIGEGEDHGFNYKKGDAGYDKLLYPAHLWFKKHLKK